MIIESNTNDFRVQTKREADAGQMGLAARTFVDPTGNQAFLDEIRQNNFFLQH